MNRDKLNALIDSYIEQFDVINDDEHDENMKWEAIYHFRNIFDLNAPDFYGMFKEAISKSSIIINNASVQPVNGILKLIEHEPDTVKNLFAMLYGDDGGDLRKRQDKIEKFESEVNGLLDKYERGKWKYKQTFRSVLAYLVFYKPEENYLYKASQCQPFFRYLEYGEEIGAGKYFDLSRYYRMCDELRSVLSSNEALLAKHNERWSKVDDPKDDLHILTFDLIYCSVEYGFFDHKVYSKPAKKKNARLSQLNTEEAIDSKRNELDALKLELKRAQEQLDELPDINIANQTVKHKLYGAGTVTGQYGSFIEVEFADKTAKFTLSSAFVRGFLSSDDTSILERCKLLEAAISEYDRTEKRVKSKQDEIAAMIAKINK